MANYERRVYEPSEEVRVFDGAEDEDDVEGSRLPLLIVLALLVLAMFGGVVWLAYTQGVARGRGETPVLMAAAGPERIAPQQPGGANVPYQGFKIYEQPAPSDDQGDAAPAAPPPAAKPPVIAAAPPVAQPGSQAAPMVEKPVVEKSGAASPPPQLKPALKATTPPETVAAKPLPAPAVKAPAAKVAAAAPPKSVAALIQQADSTSAKTPAPKTVAPKPVAVAPAPVALAPASGAPRQLGQPVSANTGQTSPASGATSGGGARSSVPAAKGGGGYVLQIGAYKSQADADAAWKSYKAKHTALLSGYGPDVQQADLGEKGTWYRLRIAGFSDREVASGLCDRLKADSGSCFLGH